MVQESLAKGLEIMLFFEKRAEQPKPYLLRRQKGNFLALNQRVFVLKPYSKIYFGTNPIFRQGRAHLIW